jgi:hypothetical protein
VIHSDPQSLHYYVVDMHKLSLDIQDIMEFPRWLSVKQIQQNLSCIALFGPMKQILPKLNNFF